MGSKEINTQQLTSVTITLRAVHEAMKKLDLSVEQKQTKIVDSIELILLINKNERTNFYIKGSTWEVSNAEL